MNKKYRFFLVLILVIFSAKLLSSDAHAQVATGEPVLVNSQEKAVIFKKEQATERIETLRTLYHDQVEKYRGSEKAFRIAQTNFENLNTLTSLENAVTATRKAMLDRADLLITFLELLDATLEDTAGVELSDKTNTLKELRNLIGILKEHRELIMGTHDREGVAILADKFVAINEVYTMIVYKTLSLIKVGRIQSVVDQAEIIYNDIVTEHKKDDVGPLIESRRTRAYKEVDRSFELINFDLAELNTHISQTEDKSFGRGYYNSVLKQLSPIYSEISQSLAHLGELLAL